MREKVREKTRVFPRVFLREKTREKVRVYFPQPYYRNPGDEMKKNAKGKLTKEMREFARLRKKLKVSQPRAAAKYTDVTVHRTVDADLEMFFNEMRRRDF